MQYNTIQYNTLQYNTMQLFGWAAARPAARPTNKKGPNVSSSSLSNYSCIMSGGALFVRVGGQPTARPNNIHIHIRIHMHIHIHIHIRIVLYCVVWGLMATICIHFLNLDVLILLISHRIPMAIC